MLTTRLVVPALLGLACLACEAPPEQEAGPTSADTVEMALAAYDAAAFDTISWASDEVAVERGNVVFQFSCAKCHGSQGYGDGNFVTRGDTIRPPSFYAADFRFPDDLPGLRQHVFTGTQEGMPHWGMEGLKYRDIDAVGRFILARLTNR